MSWGRSWGWSLSSGNRLVPEIADKLPSTKVYAKNSFPVQPTGTVHNKASGTMLG